MADFFGSKNIIAVRLQILGKIRVQHLLVLAVFYYAAGKNAVVRKGKAVRQIVKRRSEIKPLQRSAYTGLHQSFRHVRQVLLNVFRIVSVKKPVFY